MVCIIFAIGIVVCTPPQFSHLPQEAAARLSTDPFEPDDATVTQQAQVSRLVLRTNPLHL